MTTAEIKRLTSALRQAEKTKRKIAGLRDKLREECDEISAILDSVSEGIEEFEQGSLMVQNAVDHMSQYI